MSNVPALRLVQNLSLDEINKALRDIQYLVMQAVASGGKPPFSDATPLIENAQDNTKEAQFSLSGISHGATRVLTVPNRDITISDQLLHLTAVSTASVILTTSYQDITGVTLTLTRTGYWKIFASMCISVDKNDTDQLARLLFNGSAQSNLINTNTSVGSNTITMVAANEWYVDWTGSGTGICKIQGKKLAGAGNSAMGSSGAGGGKSYLTALWVHP